MASEKRTTKAPIRIIEHPNPAPEPRTIRLRRICGVNAARCGAGSALQIPCLPAGVHPNKIRNFTLIAAKKLSTAAELQNKQFLLN